MNQALRLTSSFGRTLLTLALAGLAAGAAADTIVGNAHGYSLNRQHQLLRFEALAFDDAGKVVATGTSAELRARLPGARYLDLQGHTLLPGMIDAHGHILNLGEDLRQLDLRATRTLAQAQQAIADYAQCHPHLPWITGGAWNQAIWQLGRFPNAAEIDSVLAERPVWLSRIDGHAGWANSKALQLAGIDRNTPDPAGGKIEKDADGQPTGILIDAAMGLIGRVLPEPDGAERRAALDTALQQLASYGVTSVHDAGVSAEADGLFREYATRGQLSTRVYGMLRGSDSALAAMLKKGPLLSYANDLYALRAVKLFADGALGSRGAALLAPYSDAPHSQGLLFKTQPEMDAMIAGIARRGFQVNVHAIGDAANRQVLNAFAALEPGARQVLRHRIEHAQVVALPDLERFAALGIVPSMQPTHATSDMNMAEARVGPARIEGAYAWQRLLQLGAPIACGSDFPVESANPFWGIHAAVTRQDMDNQPAGGWYPRQAMSVEQAFACFTLDAAYAAHQEQVLGSLEPGKWADFIVTDRDMFAIPAQTLHQVRVLQTWLAGRQVYERSAAVVP